MRRIVMKRIDSVLPVVAAILVGVTLASSAEARIVDKQAAQAAAEGVVNVNTATAAQLTLLPGIGPSRADAIIAARDRRPFRNANELARVRGIGRATLLRLAPYLTFDGATTLTTNVPMPRREP
jgi:competence ComEA-like helix-hairpin-helix protein